MKQQQFMEVAKISQSFASMLLAGKRHARPKVARLIGERTQTPWEIWTELGTAEDRRQAIEKQERAS